ncbi:MAG: hypothetical protein AAGD14_14870, partial [Planctomycetota bacterium]
PSDRLSREVRDLLQRDGDAQLESTVDRFRRETVSAPVSTEQLTKAGNRHHVLYALRNGTEGYSVLMDDGLPSPADSWTIQTRLETMLNTDFASESDKLAITRNYLRAMGTPDDVLLEEWTLADLYRETMQLRASVFEARRIHGLLDGDLQEPQAQKIVQALRGWHRSQHMLVILRSYIENGTRSERELAALRDARLELRIRKRRSLRDILSDAQFEKLIANPKFEPDSSRD